jgi:hypothetical protein
MAEPLKPRAFISYRHIEHESGEAQNALNAAHRKWVETFVQDLSRCDVDVIYDGHLREIFRPYTDLDPLMVPFLAEVSSICCIVCHAFIPILTPSYIDRLGYAGYERQSETKLSFVLEEWQFGMFYANAGVMQYIPIIRSGEPERMAALPLGVSPENAFDMRDPLHYDLQVRFIAERVHEAWDGGPALIKLGLRDWVMFYVSWCRENYPGCAEKRVDAWQIDLVRPRLFLDHIFQQFSGRATG